MERWMRRLPTKMALLGTVLLYLTVPVRANFDFQLYEDGKLISSASASTSGTHLVASGTAGLNPLKPDVSYAVDGLDNRPGDGTGANLQNLTIRLSNLDTAAHTFAVAMSDADFTLPALTSRSVQSTLTATFGFLGQNGATKSTDNVTYTGYYNTNNLSFATNDSSLAANIGSDAETAATDPLQRTSTGLVTNTQSLFGPYKEVPGAGTYSLTGVATSTLAGGDGISVTGETNVSATPGPSGLGLALASLPLGIGACWRRLRRRI